MKIPTYPGEDAYDSETREIYRRAMYLAIDSESGGEDEFDAYVLEMLSTRAVTEDVLLALLEAMFHCQLSKDGYAKVFGAAKRLSEAKRLNENTRQLLSEICRQPSAKTWFPEFCKDYL